MSVPAVEPGRSIGHRILSQVVRSSLGLCFGRNVASRVDRTLIRLTQGRVFSVWPFAAVVMTHVGAKSGKTRSSALVYFTDRGRAILSATSFGGSRNLAWYHNVDANPFVTLYGRGIRGRFIAKESYDAERDRLFQRAKAAPAPQASTSRQRPPNPDAFLSLHLRRRAVGAPPLWSTLRRDWCGFDDLIDAQVTGFVQYPPTRDHDPVNPHATVVAIIERATKRMLAAR